LKTLERLTIDRQRVSSVGLERLFAGLPNLRALSGRECGSGKPSLGKGAPLVDLDLSRNALGTAGVIALANEPRAHALRRLVLDTCELESLALSALIESPIWSTLRILDVSRNPLGIAGVRTLVDAPAPAQLHTLELVDCELDEQSHTALAKIPWLGQLMSLDLSGNTLGQGAAMLRAIAPDRLRHLAMASTGMVRADAATLARFWPHLVVLVLTNNPLGAAALERFAVMREAQRLQMLDLSDCALDDDGLEMIGVARAPQLRSLKLAGNTITDRGSVSSELPPDRETRATCAAPASPHVRDARAAAVARTT
jgi:Ran GTPase-activating protein (RanGAP) involved in mRNA processing and transport